MSRTNAAEQLRRSAAWSVVMAVGAVMAFTAAGARAEASTYCVKATKVATPKKHYTGGWSNSACTAVSATHEGKYEKITPSSLSESEQSELKAFLKYVKVQASGVAGKPTVQFSGANVQLVSGSGGTCSAVNGEGNLVIGYDENEGKRAQTGSHNLVLGESQSFTSCGGIVAGSLNTISNTNASVLGGFANTASGRSASVGGGSANVASGEFASVGGGYEDLATERFASVSGGASNTASGEYSWVGGGPKNKAEGELSAIFGGKGLVAKNKDEALPSCTAPPKAGELC
jgi:hypothetical protein